MPITPTPRGADIIMTIFTIPIITPLSKENTRLILPDDASTMTVLSAKIIGTGEIDPKEIVDLSRELPTMGS
jgi:hypothetical protein